MDVASLDLVAAAKSEDGGLTTYQNVPATLTSSGARMFRYNGSSFYPAGTTMDPVTFSVGSGASGSAGGGSSAGGMTTVASADGAGAAAPGAGSDGSGSSAEDAAEAAALAAKSCKATGRDLEWGFKESFRSYVSGSIANGDWTTRGGARYSTPTFIWPEGTGGFDEKKRTGAVAFPGTVTFTGHDGAMKTTLRDPQVRLQGDRAVIAMDITGASMEAAMEGRDDTTTRRGVPFVTVDLGDAKVSTKGGRTTITATEAPTELTAKGEAAFSSYTEGTAFDPVSFTITAKSDCVAPEKLGEDKKAAAALDAPKKKDSSQASGGSSDSGFPTWAAWSGGAGLGAIAAAAATILVLRRRDGAGA